MHYQWIISIRTALVEAMRTRPFTIAVDGSNDTGLEKMNPMTVRRFDYMIMEWLLHSFWTCV